jgi:hypothetical protein|tara:strand:- start:283 stop:504 length:222 start_codon:yes stop_codon:yes gene_type:complete
MKEITEIKMLPTNKICIHYGKEINVLTLQEFNELMRYRINKTKQENNARQLLLIVITLITGAILLMKLIKLFN